MVETIEIFSGKRTDMQAKRTGLFKKCPRCGRIGEVFVETDDDGLWFSIIWQSRSDRGVDRDRSMTIEDVTDPKTGCGYDPIGIESKPKSWAPWELN